MGSYLKNANGTYTLRFGRDRSSGFGAGSIVVPPGRYQCRIVSDTESAGRATGPEGGAISRLFQCEIMEPEEIEGLMCAGQKIPIFLPVPEDKADGSDKAVHFLWEPLMDAIGFDTSTLAEDQEVEVDPGSEIVGTAVEVEVYEDTWQNKVRRKARFSGPAQLSEGVVEEPEEPEEVEEEEAEPPPPPPPPRKAAPAVKATVKKAAPPVKAGLRKAPPPPRRR